MNNELQPPNLYLTLARVGVFAFVLMSVYQYLKDYLYPEISLSDSHLHTVVFTTLLATAAAYFVLRKQQALLAMLVAEANERRETGEALRTSEEKFRSIVETANEGILQIDSAYTTTYANRTMAGMLGYPTGEMLGRPLADFVVAGDLDVYWSRMAAREQGLDGRYECRLRHSDGSIRCFLVSATARKDGDGRFAGSFAMFTDITERKRTEEALQRHTEDLARLHQQLAAANREANLYLDILTHDIKNTENVANLYSDLLIDTLDGDARIHAEKLQRSIRKSIEILGNVSKIRRIHQPSGGRKQMDLDAVVRGEIAQFPEATIRYVATGCRVLADDLLSEVLRTSSATPSSSAGQRSRSLSGLTTKASSSGSRSRIPARGFPTTRKRRSFTATRRGGGVSARGSASSSCRSSSSATAAGSGWRTAYRDTRIQGRRSGLRSRKPGTTNRRLIR